MGAVRDGLGRLKAAALSHVAARRIDIRLESPTCSMTFDDVPRSALLNGVPILRRHGVPATFYVAGIFCEQPGFLSCSDVLKLAAEGFEIGCHTYSHYSLYAGNAAGLLRDAALNRVMFREKLGLRRARTFSYPFGEVSTTAKRALAHNYAALRSVYAGVNGPGTDLLLVRANPLFSHSVDWDAIQLLVETARSARGWLVFYTHGVESEPNEWGCIPADLDRLLWKCRDAGFKFETVRDVVTRIRRSCRGGSLRRRHLTVARDKHVGT